MENVLSTRVAFSVGRRLRKRQSLVLAYHNVVPPGTPAYGDASLHLDFDAFRRQLDALRDMGRVVTLGEAVLGEEEPVVAITFDDAYRGAVQLAFPELHSRGMPSTLFVAPGLLGNGMPWWDRLAGGAGNLDPELRRHCLVDLQGDSARVARAFADRRSDASRFPLHTIATESDVCQAAGQWRFGIGGHSWSHASLPRLTPQELQSELSRTHAWARSTLPDLVVPYFAYPYGHETEAVQGAVARAGYEAGLLVTGSWFRPGATSPTAVARLNIPASLTSGGFKARLAGMWP